MNRLFVFTGAGCSAPSGLGTFRDAGGLWDEFDKDEVCNIATWMQNYEEHHRFYNQRRTEYGKAKPNPAHYQIAEWQKTYGDRVKIATTNVDGLLERAGAENVLHIHGYIDEMIFNANTNDERVDNIGFIEFDAIGHKERTGELCKPNVRLFGESVPEYSEFYDLVKGINEEDIVIIIGASNVVIDFAGLVAGRAGYCIEVNKELESEDEPYRLVRGNNECCSVEVPKLDKFVRNWLD